MPVVTLSATTMEFDVDIDPSRISGSTITAVFPGTIPLDGTVDTVIVRFTGNTYIELESPSSSYGFLLAGWQTARTGEVSASGTVTLLGVGDVPILGPQPGQLNNAFGTNMFMGTSWLDLSPPISPRIHGARFDIPLPTLAETSLWNMWIVADARPTGTVRIGTVPEPSSAALLAIGILSVLFGRRRA